MSELPRIPDELRGQRERVALASWLAAVKDRESAAMERFYAQDEIGAGNAMAQCVGLLSEMLDDVAELAAESDRDE